MIYFTNNLLLLFFSSIWCYWPPWAFLLFLTGNIFQYSRINSIGGNFFSLYIYIKRGNSFLQSSDCLLSDHRSRQKVVRRCHICPRLVMCLLSAFNHIWRQSRSLNEQIQAYRKYKLKPLNYFERHPRYSSKKYIDDLGKYLQLRLRRINRAARTTIYLASSKTFIAKERYGVVSWQELKKYFFGSTDSDALSSKKTFSLSFHDAFISHIKISLQREVLLLITRRWGPTEIIVRCLSSSCILTLSYVSRRLSWTSRFNERSRKTWMSPYRFA